jgi:transposase
LGRSRGGFSTKIHVLCDGEGRPLNVELSPGQTHETQLFDELWNTTAISDRTLKHLIQPDALAGDKAYRSAKIIDQLDAEHVQPVIPEKGNKANDVDHPDFDREAYRRRNVVERLFGRLKEFRRIFSRFEKTAVNYLGMIHATFVRLYLNEMAE